MHENIERVLVSEEELHQINARLGAQITRDYAGKNLLVVGILKGSVLFMADLIREIQLPCKLDFLAVSSYGGDTRSSGVVKIVKDIDIELEVSDLVIRHGYGAQHLPPLQSLRPDQLHVDEVLLQRVIEIGRAHV